MSYLTILLKLLNIKNMQMIINAEWTKAMKHVGVRIGYAMSKYLRGQTGPIKWPYCDSLIKYILLQQYTHFQC